MWIGENEITEELAINDGTVELTLKEGNKLTITQELYDLIAKDEQGKGTITDNVYHVLSARYLTEMAKLGLEYYTVEGVATAMRVLAHNLREELIRKTFECSGGDAIKLNKLV